jgi:hypothetical protein
MHVVRRGGWSACQVLGKSPFQLISLATCRAVSSRRALAQPTVRMRDTNDSTRNRGQRLTMWLQFGLDDIIGGRWSRDKDVSSCFGSLLCSVLRRLHRPQLWVRTPSLSPRATSPPTHTHATHNTQNTTHTCDHLGRTLEWFETQHRPCNSQRCSSQPALSTQRYSRTLPAHKSSTR